MATQMRRGVTWGWLLPLLLAVAGCGPGVGGTGTGEQGFGLDYFGARRASVCNASFAGELKCPSRIVIGPSPVPDDDGSAPVAWADDADAPRTVLRVSGSEADFEADCGSTKFAGSWGTVAPRDSRFFGHYTLPGVAIALPGSLIVASGADGLSFEIRDETNRTVLGPVPLQRADSETPAPACPAFRQSAS